MKNNKLNKLFPLVPQNSFKEAIGSVYDALNIEKQPRINGWHDADKFPHLVKEYSKIPQNIPNDPEKISKKIASDFFKGAVNWRSPFLQYNVGAPTNVFASAAYAVAMDVNVYNINDGLSGNLLASERTVVEIMAELAGVKPDDAAGLFTFGGTATNLYALKLGLSKAIPASRSEGLFGEKVKIFISEDAHFSHMRGADWLGIGTSNVEVIKADVTSRESQLSDLKKKVESAIKKGCVVPTIIINGGTTYSQTIDDISAFVNFRDELVKKHKLSYKPHIHVDSVIGWSWLVFKGYDFEKNELGIKNKILIKLKKQYERISQINMADSWGIDFHKGVGSCPIDSSLFMVNSVNDIKYLSRKLDPKVKIHQLAGEFSILSPVEYTLETSRSGGASLSALVMLHTEGLNGIRLHLASLVENVSLLEEKLEQIPGFKVANAPSNGFVAMVRVYPPQIKKDFFETELSDKSDQTANKIKKINDYVKAFFTYDLKTRMSKNNSFEYSFSSEYLQTVSNANLSALKFYPTSPHFDRSTVDLIVHEIGEQKQAFDKLK